MRAGWAAALAATALLAACSRPDDAPGTLSAEDERRLDEAAAMLDANAVDTNAVDTDAAAANAADADMTGASEAEDR